MNLVIVSQVLPAKSRELLTCEILRFHSSCQKHVIPLPRAGQQVTESLKPLGCAKLHVLYENKCQVHGTSGLGVELNLKIKSNSHPLPQSLLAKKLMLPHHPASIGSAPPHIPPSS